MKGLNNITCSSCGRQFNWVDFLFINTPPFYTLECRECDDGIKISPLVELIALLSWIVVMWVIFWGGSRVFVLISSELWKILIMIILLIVGLFGGFYTYSLILSTWIRKGYKQKNDVRS